MLAGFLSFHPLSNPPLNPTLSGTSFCLPISTPSFPNFPPHLSLPRNTSISTSARIPSSLIMAKRYFFFFFYLSFHILNSTHQTFHRFLTFFLSLASFTFSSHSLNLFWFCVCVCARCCINVGNRIMQSFQLDKMYGKKCYMLSARTLFIVWGDTPRYWAWTSLPDAR